MDKKIIHSNGIDIAVVFSDTPIIADTPSALDLMMTVQYNDKTDKLAINKEAITEDFFMLSTGIAGEILQKFINYSVKIAIFGDFSQYTSKPLKDFIYECNNGNNVFFVDDVDSAIKKLANL